MYKEKYLEMVEALKEEKDILDFVREGVDSFVAYVSAVETMELQLPILRFRCEAEEYREAAINLDKNRRLKHNRAIDAANQINRVCDLFDIEHLFTCDMEDRNEVGIEISKLVTEFLEAGIVKKDPAR